LGGTNTYPPLNATLTRTQVIDNQMNGVTARTIIDSEIRRNAGYGVRSAGQVRGSTIASNLDGGIMGGWDTLVISDSVISGNSSTLALHIHATTGVGGQIAAGVVASDVILERSVVADNHLIYLDTAFTPQLIAGGVAATNFIAIDSTIRDNSITGLNVTGGGVAIRGSSASGYARFYRSTISGNRAIGEGARGGGVFGPRSVQLVQSTVSGNAAEGEGSLGGGVYAEDLLAIHSTIANNSADSSGGGAYAIRYVTLEGTILAGNSAGTEGPDLYNVGTGPLSVAYSLIQDTAGSGIDASTGDGNLLGIDPLLGPLGDNGGPTWTHALLPGSPAIDAGDPTRTTVPWSTPAIGGFYGANFTGDVDQRGAGFPRLVDGGTGVLRIDMGAVEAEAPIAPAYVGTPPMISIEPTTTNEPSLSLPESYDIAFAELSVWRASLLIELSDLNTLHNNDAASFELLEDLVAADRSQETIDDAVRAEFSSWAR
jgi:hypothetical protein